jgi:hypothetical protein
VTGAMSGKKRIFFRAAKEIINAKEKKSDNKV